MNKVFVFALSFAVATLAADAQQTGFAPKHLAVLRAGDGTLDLHLKQSPIFIDQFSTDGFSAAPSFTVAIPTNGGSTLFFNGHAATEGTLARSADGKLLSFAGYSGVNLLESNGTPSLLGIKRAYGTVDGHGTEHTIVYKDKPGVNKMNPRGVVTDGSNNFWGCGNSLGTVYYNPASSAPPVEILAMPSSRDIKIVGNVLYAAMNGADGKAQDMSAGIYSFEDGAGNAALLPRQGNSSLKLVVPTEHSYNKNVGFDINSEATTAYIADTVAGVQKYVKTNGAWKFAYNFSIPQNIPETENHGAGCFGLVADFSQTAPIIYATTTEGYGGSVNSNRVIRIVDTGATATVTTLAQATSTNIAFRGIDFTPSEKP